MKKRVFKVFLNVLNGQENWLNDMATRGYRLTKTSLFYYEFEPCLPNEYSYRVQFVANQSYQELLEYKQYLKDLEIQTFSKNINIGKLSFGEIRFRPYATRKGMLATSPGMINKELLILEQKTSQKPFLIYTSLEDLIDYYKLLRRTFLSIDLLFLIIEVITFQWLFILFTIPLSLLVLYYMNQLSHYKKEAMIKEQ